MNLRLTSLYAGVICCVLLLAWLVFFSGNDLSKSPAEQQAANATQSGEALKNQQSSIRESLSYKPRKKRINVKARLATLYEKYPELKPDFPESDKDFSELFQQLFPEEEGEDLSKMFEDMGAMLKDESTWDEEVARQFLVNQEWRLEALIENADPEHHYKELDLSMKFQYYSLLAVSHGIRLKLDDAEGASALMTALGSMTATSVEADGLGMVLAVYGQNLIDDYAFPLASDYPEDVSGLVNRAFEVSFADGMKGEFTTSVELAYLMLESSGGEGVEVDEEGSLVGIEVFEKVIAERSLDRMSYYQGIEDSGVFKSSEDIEAEYEIYVKNLNYNEEEMQVMGVIGISFGSIYESLVKTRTVQEARGLALSIALHGEDSTEEYPFEIPLNPKTGEPIEWDKERGVLLTGLEGKYAEIKIPVLKSE